MFDFAPQVRSGAEILARRGDDQRLHAERPSVARRRELDASYHEARARQEGRFAPDRADDDEPGPGDDV